MKSVLRCALRTAGITAATTGLLLLGAGVASAHVTIDPSTTAAGSYAVLTLAVPHGCDGSSTTSVAIKMPEAINAVTPTVNPGWTVEKKMQKLDTPIDNGHGGQLTERVDQVVYTAKTPLPDGLRDVFELSVQLPDTPGATLVFPAIQTCEQGETDWIEVAADGQAEPAHPAPFIVISAAAADGHGAADEHGAAATGPEASPDSGPGTVTWIALALGALGVLIGGAALLRGRPAR